MPDKLVGDDAVPRIQGETRTAKSAGFASTEWPAAATSASFMAESASLNAEASIELMDARIAAAERQAETLSRAIAAIHASTSWRLTEPLRRVAESSPGELVVKKLRGLLGWLVSGVRESRDRMACPNGLKPVTLTLNETKDANVPSNSIANTDTYNVWLNRFERFGASDHRAIAMHLSRGELPPVTIVVDCEMSSPEEIERVIHDVVGQIYDDWSAIILCKTAVHCEDSRISQTCDRRSLSRPLAQSDGHSGGIYLLVGAGIVLRPYAVYAFVEALMSAPDCLLAYSDEDRMDNSGRRSEPLFKPRFSPELFRDYPYTGLCVAVRYFLLHPLVALLENHLSMSASILLLPSVVPSATVHHIPLILFHCDGQGIAVPRGGLEELPSILSGETVTIIIPTRDKVNLLRTCIESIETRTRSRSRILEIIVVDNGSSEPDTMRFLHGAEVSGRIRLISDPEPFNYSRLNNRAARESSGDILVFLNNDTEVLDEDWLEKLVRYAARPDVAAVGAKLLFPDGSVQHGGVLLGLGGAAGHLHVGAKSEAGGYMGLGIRTREISAVTGACLAIRREIFWELGGFNEKFPIVFNDIILCTDALARGYRNICVADPLLIHHESKTRGDGFAPEKQVFIPSEASLARALHPVTFKDDPFYNPNLSLERPYELAVPPRSSMPWRLMRARRLGLLRVLFLSMTYRLGHAVSVVIKMQAEHLASIGHIVYVGGPESEDDLEYRGCHRIPLADVSAAAEFAYKYAIDCLVVHTMPFMSLVRIVGVWPKVVIYEHGKPEPKWFGDVEVRRAQDHERDFCRGVADRVLTISEAVRSEIRLSSAVLVRPGNSHMPGWRPEDQSHRMLLRERLDWGNKIAVLNVCRFYSEERTRKGIDDYIDAMEQINKHPLWSGRFHFVLCGRATSSDVERMTAEGLEVHANISDGELADLYRAADIFVNLSRWEGYNLGIAQALGFGLPVIASDIPAHREFPITIVGNPVQLVGELAELAKAQMSDKYVRTVMVLPWKVHQVAFTQLISETCGVTHWPP
jgi:GT2 family glycosyltransferase/glycosyltransferase involved in cell wall biosynthesis